MNVRAWLRTAEPGARRIYYTGHLARDRQFDPDLELVAHEMLRASEAGLVQLNQVRGPDGRMMYLATRTKEISE